MGKGSFILQAKPAKIRRGMLEQSLEVLKPLLESLSMQSPRFLCPDLQGLHPEFLRLFFVKTMIS